MRGPWLILVSLAAIAAAPASACIPLAAGCIGDGDDCNPTPAERRLQERRSSAEETRRLTLDALGRLRKREANPAAELAEILVPNVRPVRIEVSDCGPVNEVDPAEGRETIESIFAEVAGAQAAGAEWSHYDNLFRIDDIYPFGERCNAEFRGRFAEFLRRSLSPDRLREAWIFLSARRRDSMMGWLAYHRLVMFESRARTPPVRWIFPNEWIRKETLGALRRTEWGPALASATAAWWSLHGEDMKDDSSACPAAASEWARERARLRARMPEKRRRG